MCNCFINSEYASVLAEALHENSLNIANSILDYFGSHLELTLVESYGCFTTACAHGRTTEINKMIRMFSNIVNRMEYSRTPPLSIAIRHNHYFTAKALIDAGALVRTPNNEGRTALHEAAGGGGDDLRIIKLLEKDNELEIVRDNVRDGDDDGGDGSMEIHRRTMHLEQGA